jgi:hypothetical protein
MIWFKIMAASNGFMMLMWLLAACKNPGYIRKPNISFDVKITINP